MDDIENKTFDEINIGDSAKNSFQPPKNANEAARYRAMRFKTHGMKPAIPYFVPKINTETYTLDLCRIYPENETL